MQRTIWGGFVLPALLFAVLLMLVQAGPPADAQSGLTNFDSVALSGDLTVGDDATIGDNLTANDLIIADLVRIAAQTEISVTNGGIITPTGTTQALESAGTVTATISTASHSAGDQLTLYNTTDTTINIADTGTAKLSAAAALGQYDTLELMFDGTNWLELSRSDN